MTKMIRIADLRELSENRPIAAHVSGVDLVVVKYGDRVTAFEGKCPHQGTLLAEGTFDRDVVTCRGHGWRFECASGTRVDAPGTGLRSFRTRIEGNAVLADHDELLAWRKLCDQREPSQSPLSATRSLGQLTGPKGLPLLGNLLQLHLDSLHLDLERWAKEYGPMYTFFIARKPVVVIGDPTSILAILRDRPETYRRLSTIQEVNRELGISGVFSAEDEDWRRQRGAVTAGLDPNTVELSLMPV